jgi:hypothetical protein
MRKVRPSARRFFLERTGRERERYVEMGWVSSREGRLVGRLDAPGRPLRSRSSPAGRSGAAASASDPAIKHGRASDARRDEERVGTRRAVERRRGNELDLDRVVAGDQPRRRMPMWPSVRRAATSWPLAVTSLSPSARSRRRRRRASDSGSCGGGAADGLLRAAGTAATPVRARTARRAHSASRGTSRRAESQPSQATRHSGADERSSQGEESPLHFKQDAIFTAPGWAGLSCVTRRDRRCS